MPPWSGTEPPLSGTLPASDSDLAHREFGSNGAAYPGRILSGQTRPAYICRAQTSPGQNAGQAAPFANSLSLASRPTQEAYRTEAAQCPTGAAGENAAEICGRR